MFDGLTGEVGFLDRPVSPRARRGEAAYFSGVLAEDQVADHYAGRGYRVLARRWRGQAGEIDLVLGHGVTVVFVEVKKAITLARAAERLSRRQMDRICLAASEYCGTIASGMLTEMRFDAALVDEIGGIEIVENAFGA